MFKDNSRRLFLKSTAGLTAGLVCNKSFGSGIGNVVYESRAILDEGLHWVTRESAQRLFDKISRAGFNVFIPCVWHGKGASWQTKIAPWDNRLNSEIHIGSIDYLLQIAAAYKIEVHPWFTIGLRQRDFFRDFTTSSSSESFDFHKPAFRDFAVDMVLEFVERYPIQGINLDFVRFNSPRPGQEIEQESVVFDVIKRISEGAKRIRKGLVISVDAAPYQQERMKQFGQDSIKWAEQGIVDVVYSMQYQRNPDFDVIKKIKSKMQRPQALVVMVGNYERALISRKVTARDPAIVNELIVKSRALSSANGVALYYYGRLDEEQIKYLKNNVFKVIAEPRWKRSS